MSTFLSSIGRTIGGAFDTVRTRPAGASSRLFIAESRALPTVRARYGGSAPSTTIQGASAVLVARRVASEIR